MLMSTGDKTTGGEGGIRTLDTGVSPHNGLANSTRPLPIARIQSDKVFSSGLSWAEIGCSADGYAPEYAPRGSETKKFEDKGLPRLINRRVDDLRPHPSYVKHQLFVSPDRLAALTGPGDVTFHL